MSQRLESAILATIAYTDQFNYALSVHQLKSRVLAEYLSQPNHQLRDQTLLLGLSNLEKKGLIIRLHDLVALSTSPQNFKQTQQRTQFSETKWVEARQVAKSLSRLPWIWGVFVTGSLAMSNVVKDDDIDFLLITQKNRLWLSRLVVFLFTLSKGKRRSRLGPGKNSWCFNMWLEIDRLQLPEKQRSIYTAYEVLQTQCLFSRHQTQQLFYDTNSWIQHRLPFSGLALEQNMVFDSPPTQPALQKNLDFWLAPLLFLINLFVYFGQRLYMWPHQTLEKIGRDFAFFHPRHTKQIIMRRWIHSLRKLYEN